LVTLCPALSSAGAGAVNTALFIQNAVQLRNLVLLQCEETNGTETVTKFYRDCFDTHYDILFILISFSLAFQFVYAVFVVIGTFALSISTFFDEKFKNE